MTWAAVSDDLLDRMHFDGLDRDDMLMYVEGLVYASRLLSDGVLPADLSTFTKHPQAAEGALRLLGSKYWQVHAKGYEIVDYLKNHRSAEQVTKDRERNRLKQQRARMHRDGDHSLCLRSYCSKAPETLPNRVTNPVTNPVSNRVPSPPLPGEGKLEDDRAPAEARTAVNEEGLRRVRAVLDETSKKSTGKEPVRINVTRSEQEVKEPRTVTVVRVEAEDRGAK